MKTVSLAVIEELFLNPNKCLFRAWTELLSSVIIQYRLPTFNL